MTKNTRMLFLLLSLLMLLGLIIVRQVNQVKFIRIQDISREQRLMQQSVGQTQRDYLLEKNKVPSWAKQNGYVIRRHE